MEQLWGIEPGKLHQHLHKIGARAAQQFVTTHANLIHQLDAVKALLGSERRPLIYEGTDEFRKHTQSYDINEKPADNIDSFSTFIHDQLNQSAALTVVVNRPKDLTWQQLRKLPPALSAISVRRHSAKR